jgi:hypothetical protein
VHWHVCVPLDRHFFFLPPIFMRRMDPLVICGFAPNGFGLLAAFSWSALRVAG